MARIMSLMTPSLGKSGWPQKSCISSAPEMPRAVGKGRDPCCGALSGGGRRQAVMGWSGPGDALTQAKYKSSRYPGGIPGTWCLTEKTSRCF